MTHVGVARSGVRIRTNWESLEATSHTNLIHCLGFTTSTQYITCELDVGNEHHHLMFRKPYTRLLPCTLDVASVHDMQPTNTSN